MNRVLRLAIASFAGYVLAGGLIGRLLPAQELPHTVREKAAHLSERGNDYDAIFLGSSRIQNHISTEIFDRCMASAGMPTKSFNFGISSMHPPEDAYVLDEILAHPHGKLRWVFVEVDYLNTEVGKDESGTMRGAYWHDWPRFSLLCRCLSVGQGRGFRSKVLDAFRRWSDFVDHAQLFGQQWTGVGRGAQIFQRWLFRIPTPPMDWTALGKAGDGWLPAAPKEQDVAERESGRLRSILRERMEKRPSQETDDIGGQMALADLIEKITRSGATPVLFIPPRARQGYFYPEPGLASRYPIVDLCNPQKFPDLYREDLRVDASHLNKPGAEILTRIVAEQFIDAIRKP